MSQTPKKSNTNGDQLTPELLKEILQHQAKQLQLEEKRLQIEDRQLDRNAKFAEKSLDYNAEWLKHAPKEQRKNIITFAIIGIILLLIILAFITVCLWKGKDEFVRTFLTWMGHIVGSVIGFIVGRKTAKNNKTKSPDKDGISDVEVVED